MKESIKHTYHIDGMSCNGCATTVKKRLSGIPNVTFVEVDLANKKAEVTSTSDVSIETLRAALNNTGYSIT